MGGPRREKKEKKLAFQLLLRLFLLVRSSHGAEKGGGKAGSRSLFLFSYSLFSEGDKGKICWARMYVG